MAALDLSGFADLRAAAFFFADLDREGVERGFAFFFAKVPSDGDDADYSVITIGNPGPAERSDTAVNPRSRSARVS